MLLTTFRIMALSVAVAAFCDASVAQEKLIKKSWIKFSVEELGRVPMSPDTNYIRYVFENDVVLYGFDPGWHSGIQVPYELKGNLLKIAFDQWTIETLTDSTLTIFLQGFRRMKFLAEDYLISKENHLEQIGEHNNKPLYKANRIITPHYKRSAPLSSDILKQDRSDDYNIHKAGSFVMTFIVTDEGKIEDPKILKGVTAGYDKKVVGELLKTSKRWAPAVFNGQAVQTLMVFEIQFLIPPANIDVPDSGWLTNQYCNKG